MNLCQMSLTDGPVLTGEEVCLHCAKRIRGAVGVLSVENHRNSPALFGRNKKISHHNRLMRKRRSLGLIGPTAAGRLLGCPRQSVYYLVKTKRLRPARRTPTGFWPDDVVRYGELLKTLPPERRGRPRGSRNPTEIERIVRGIFRDALGAETRDEAVAAMAAARERNAG